MSVNMTSKDIIEKQVISTLEVLLSMERGRLTVHTQRTEIAEWDSIKQLEIMLELEKQFSVRFSAPEITENREIQQILELIYKKTSKIS